mmetsp:Transcript_56319/g.93130  ORF Transcript_56319/g.93130 Transcript_56319/m.93130 type:complete len:239 (+) Transcript_56319:1-717(+)
MALLLARRSSGCCIEVEGSWYASTSADRPLSFAAKLNAYVDRCEREIKAALEKKLDAVCNPIIELFKQKCMDNAQAGVMTARYVLNAHQKPASFDEGQWRLATLGNGAEAVAQRLKSDANKLGLDNVVVEIGKDGQAFGPPFALPEPAFSGTYRPLEESGEHMAWALAKAVHDKQHNYLVVVSYKARDDDDVEVSGERSREQRDSELRKRAVNVDALISTPSTDVGNKRVKREREIAK